MLALALAAALAAAATPTPEALTAHAGVAARTATAPPSRAQQQRNLKVFDAAWGALNRRYFDRSFGGQDWKAVRRELRPKAAAATSELDLYLNVLDAMTRRLPSSHVSATPPQGRPTRVAKVAPGPECTEAFTKVDLGMRPGRSWAPKIPMVVAVVDKGSPAERAGIEPGAALDGWSVSAVNCKSFRVELELGGAEGKRKVAYDAPQTPPRPDFAVETLESGVRVIRFDEFTPELVERAKAALADAPPEGVILDLRENFGGLLITAQALAAAVVPPGSALGTQHGARGAHVLVAETPPGVPLVRYGGPLAVLVGPRSASAAEIVAEALRHHRRAVVVGERSSGSVLVGKEVALPDGGHLMVAVADFTAPSGGRLEDVGVIPDVEARQTLAAIRSDRDLVVEAAERALRERPAQLVTAGARPPSS